MVSYIWQNPDWPNFRWDANSLLEPLGACRRAQGQLLTRVAGLGLPLANQSHAEILVEETVKTSAIEGETLDARSVRSSVARRLGLPSAGLPVDRRIDDLVAVLLDATQNFTAPLSAERLWGWQAALFPSGYSGLHRIKVGGWRDSAEPMRVVSGAIGRERIHFEAPPANRLDAEMQRFLDWFNTGSETVEGILRAALAHLWFVSIHPFDDGNGRIARALTDMALAQDDQQPARYFSLSTQIMAERNGYYSILESTQKSSCDVTAWLAWFLDCYVRSIRCSADLLDGVFMRAEFWQHHAQVPLSDRQRKVISRLLEAGPDGFEGGMTTRKYAALTGASRATAFRELDQLYEAGILIRSGQGRSVRYELATNRMAG
ncbi:MAG: Fic family protein [Desulfuromonadales bacterium]|nr:Fic family protein [Desulfuromonadales bacterium]